MACVKMLRAHMPHKVNSEHRPFNASGAWDVSCGPTSGKVVDSLRVIGQF